MDPVQSMFQRPEVCRCFSTIGLSCVRYVLVLWLLDEASDSREIKHADDVQSGKVSGGFHCLQVSAPSTGTGTGSGSCIASGSGLPQVCFGAVVWCYMKEARLSHSASRLNLDH